MNLRLAAFLCISASFVRADILDLSGDTTTGTRNGATFTVFDFHAAGTGVLDPFLRIQNTKPAMTCGESNATRECGYNTDGGVDSRTDTKTGAWTHALSMDDYSGSFTLDINEPGGRKSYLSIDQLQIYGANVADVDAASTTYSPRFPNGTLHNDNLTLLWSLDGGTPATDYTIFVTDRFSGSGTTDLKIDIPKAVFYQPSETFDYLVLFANMGNVDLGWKSGDAQGGFEEFAAIAAAPVPEPAAVWLFAPAAALFLVVVRKRRRS